MDWYSRWSNRRGGQRLLKEFSVMELTLIQQAYKDIFLEQIRQPTADNNHIINYSLKLKNFLLLNSTIHMLSASGLIFGVHILIGPRLERFVVNYLGSRRGSFAQIILYFGYFWYALSWLNGSQRLNVNPLINPRDFNGDIMMNLILKYLPHKVNTDMYR